MPCPVSGPINLDNIHVPADTQIETQSYTHGHTSETTALSDSIPANISEVGNIQAAIHTVDRTTDTVDTVSIQPMPDIQTSPAYPSSLLALQPEMAPHSNTHAHIQHAPATNAQHKSGGNMAYEMPGLTQNISSPAIMPYPKPDTTMADAQHDINVNNADTHGQNIIPQNVPNTQALDEVTIEDGSDTESNEDHEPTTDKPTLDMQVDETHADWSAVLMQNIQQGKSVKKSLQIKSSAPLPQRVRTRSQGKLDT